MNRKPPLTCPAGAAILTQIQIGSDKALKLDMFMPSQGNMKVTAQGLDSGRFPICDLKGKAVEPVIVVAKAIPKAEPLALESRIREVLGKTPLYRTSCTLTVPSFQSPALAFVQLEIEPPVAETADTRVMKKPEDRIILEISNRTLGKVVEPTLFWLLTRKKANQRIEKIAQQYGLFDRDDHATNDALVNLVYAILSGVDTPLLTEPLEEDDNDE